MVDVVREAFGDERVGRWNRNPAIPKQFGRRRHRRSKHGERIRALSIDIGCQQIGEFAQHAVRLDLHHLPQRWLEAGAVDAAEGGRSNRDPTQPGWGDLRCGRQQLVSWMRGLHIAIHHISSIVKPVPALPQRPTAGIARSIGAVTVVTTLALVGCTGDDEAIAPSTSLSNDSTTTTTIERPNDGQLKIGLFLPRTGEGAQLGEPMIDAITDAVNLINDAGGVFGTDVAIEIVDSGAGTGPDPLLSSGVDAIIGPASSRLALTHLASMVQPSTGVVTCSPTATAVALDDFPGQRILLPYRSQRHASDGSHSSQGAGHRYRIGCRRLPR